MFVGGDDAELRHRLRFIAGSECSRSFAGFRQTRVPAAGVLLDSRTSVAGLQRVDERRRFERQRSRPGTATGVSEFLRAVRGSPDIRSILIPGRSVVMFRQRSKPLAGNLQTGEASELFCTDVNSASVRVVSVEMRVEAAPVTAEWECDAPWEA